MPVYLESASYSCLIHVYYTLYINRGLAVDECFSRYLTHYLMQRKTSPLLLYFTQFANYKFME